MIEENVECPYSEMLQDGKVLLGHVHLSCVVVEHCKNHQKQFFAINQPIDDISLPNFQGICKTI